MANAAMDFEDMHGPALPRPKELATRAAEESAKGPF